MAKNRIKDLTDDCGKINSISEHATMMVPFYYLPLLVLILLPAVKLLIKAFRLASMYIANYDIMRCLVIWFYMFGANLFIPDI